MMLEDSGIAIAQLAQEDAEIINAAMQKLGWLKPGRNPSVDQLVVPRFHLRCLRQEWDRDTPSELSLKLAERLQPMFDGPGQVKWFGDPFENFPTASAILSSMPIMPPSERISDIMDFYHGRQWYSEIRAEREKHQRPTLIVNMLPRLVAAALDAQRAQGLPVLSPDDIERLIVILAFRNADAQRLYNYMVSWVAEITALDIEGRKYVIKAADLQSVPGYAFQLQQNKPEPIK